MNKRIIWLKRIYWLIIIGLSLSACVFYYFQNHGSGLGGKIALPKLIWLAYALWFWYFLPLLIRFDLRVNLKLKRGYWLFWLNMLLRAIVELYMMYFSKNWHPHWGIAHNLFSALLILVLLRKIKVKNSLDGIVYFNFQVMGLLFLIESYFAWYMLNHVRGESAVYFVPDRAQHAGIIILTWILISILTVQQLIFARQWLYKSAVHK